MYANILTEVDHGVGIVTLMRQEQANAFHDATLHELAAAFAAMEADAAVRVMVLSSVGGVFSTGTLEDNQASAELAAAMLRTLAQMKKPTVVRIQGPVYGVAVGLVAACDVALATFDAEFALSGARHGLTPGVIAPYLVDAVGLRHARRYLLTAETFAATEAYRIGLVHEMVADEAALDAAIGEIVAALLDSGSPAQAVCKAALLAGRGVAVQEPRHE